MAEKRFFRAGKNGGAWKTGDLCSRRLAAGLLLMDAAEAVAFVNGTYFHRGLKGQYGDLQAMDETPEGFLAFYQQAIQAGDAPGAGESLRGAARRVGKLVGERNACPGPGPAGRGGRASGRMPPPWAPGMRSSAPRFKNSAPAGSGGTGCWPFSQRPACSGSWRASRWSMRSPGTRCWAPTVGRPGPAGPGGGPGGGGADRRHPPERRDHQGI